jgi:hypothetical protein
MTVKINGVTVHPSVTIEIVHEAALREMTTLDNPGFCISCGEETDGCEPDARKHECECCGEPAVYGAAELLLHMA